jgi:GDPmannose 4,6-dehydratase
VSRITCGFQKKLYLGNLNAKRDWGFAPEYCEGMWSMLQQQKPDDFVLATGETHTVREFTELAFNELGVELDWKGKNENEKGIVNKINDSFENIIHKNIKVGDTIVEVDKTYYRPTEVDILIGDASKAKKILGWKSKTMFPELVKLMVKADYEKVLKRGY